MYLTGVAMPNSDRYDRFMAAYRNLDLFPLLDGATIENFRVEHGQPTLARLNQKVRSLNSDGKVVFTGHRGCGKSTLLYELAGSLHQSSHFTVFFSIAEMVEMSDVNHINILYSVAMQLLNRATRQQISIPDKIKDDLLGWNSETKNRIRTDELKGTMAIGVALDFVKGQLQKEQSFREEVKVKFERRISDLAGMIDRIAGAIQVATQKKVLVIIDDLDKLDLSTVNAIYRNNINALFSPSIRIIFTIPISVVREPSILTTLQSACSIVLLPVTKFYPQDQAHRDQGVAIAENVDSLLKMLNKRIDPDLIEPEVARQIVLLSGGVLRELIRLGQECCQECMVELDLNRDQPDFVINEAILAAAVKTLRNQFARGLGSQLYELLVKTYQDFTPPDARDEDFLELLHGLYVLEYENDDLWYDLHPLVTDLLRRKQLLPVST